MFLFHCLLNSEVCNQMALTNVVSPNSSKTSVKQNTSSVIIAWYATSFFFPSINTWLSVTLWLEVFGTTIDIYFSTRKVLERKKEKRRQLQTKGTSTGRGLAAPVPLPSIPTPGFVTSAVPERKINNILSKTYFWMLLKQPFTGNQSRTQPRCFSWQEFQVFIVD